MQEINFICPISGKGSKKFILIMIWYMMAGHALKINLENTAIAYPYADSITG